MTMFTMFVGSFIIQYFLMSHLMVHKTMYVRNNVGKAYLATIMALSMVLIEVMMHDHQYHTFSWTWYAILIGLLAITSYLYRKQIAVDDKQYLEGMIEHHSMALFMSDEILKKTNNYHVAKLAKDIIQTQNDEIQYMSNQLKKI